MASDPPGMPRLIVQSGPGAGQSFEVDGEVIVGRGDVDCVIDDAELSRRHIAVRATPAGVEVEDLGSLNGTWFKGKRLEGPTVISDGGVIRLGETELVVESVAVDAGRTVVAPAASPPPVAADPPPPPSPPVDVEPPPPPPPVDVGPPPPPPPAPEPVAPPAAPEPASAGPPPTNIPAKPPKPRRPAADAVDPPADVDAPLPPAPPDASTVPPRRRRPAEPAPPAPPSPRRRPAAPRAGDAPVGAFSPPAKPGRRKVATRLVLPALLTFLTIFLTAIALIVYFATR